MSWVGFDKVSRKWLQVNVTSSKVKETLYSLFNPVRSKNLNQVSLWNTATNWVSGEVLEEWNNYSKVLSELVKNPMVSFTLFCLYIKANLNNFLSDFRVHQQSALCCMTLCFSHLKRMSKTNRVLCKMCLFVCFFLFPHCISACTLSPLNSLIRDTQPKELAFHSVLLS